MKGCRKVLIAVDGSMEVLKKGIDLADDEKSWITVLRVIPPFEGDLNLTGIKNIGDVLDGGGRLLAAEVAKVAEAERAPVKTRIEAGEVHRKIVEVAAEERCDLIVLGAKKRKGLLGRMLGDRVVEKVIDGAPCPVFVVEAGRRARPACDRAFGGVPA